MAFDLESFHSIKLISLFFSFLTIAIWQGIYPLLKQTESIRRNWLINLSLGVIGSIIVGILCDGCLIWAAVFSAKQNWGLFNLLKLPLWMGILLSVPLLDFLSYVWHRANHQVPFLWRFHAVHHSDTVYDVSSAFRFHPFEIVMSLMVRISMILLFSLPWQGILIFEIIFTIANIFEHGNIRLQDQFEQTFGRFFISPSLHRLHHSALKEDVDRNFGTIFSFWDRLGKSFLATRIEISPHPVGLPDSDIKVFELWDLLLSPWRRKG